jgi:UDP-galactopyranose mutase
MSLPTLVVFSHLRWNFVYQRPQHLLSRLAGRWRVVFVEEPVVADGAARLQTQAVLANLSVVVPYTPVQKTGFNDEQQVVLEPLLQEHFRANGLQGSVVWLYTPMALPLVDTVQPRCLVYDCMDELSAFKDAPQQLREREMEVMEKASLVFTGGPSLYEAKRHWHPDVHCIPSAVDVDHFSPTNLQLHSQTAAQVEALQGGLGRPRIGYFGVIDERMDYGLVRALAEARSDWEVVMVGPVVKVDPAVLPRQANLHWLGMQSYERLPYFLAGWDLCIMPFALNESTRMISPTKTLEYLAGEKPVVSTAVADVVSLYGNVVEIGTNSQAFIEACDAVLNEGPLLRSWRASETLMTISVYSWDRSADTIHRLIAQRLDKPSAPMGVTEVASVAAQKKPGFCCETRLDRDGRMPAAESSAASWLQRAK